MRLELATDVEGVRPLVTQWRRLATGHPAATPYVLPEWALAWWWHGRSAPAQWRCVSGHEPNGDVIGVIPLLRYGAGVATVSGVELADSTGALVAPERMAELWEATVTALRRDGVRRLDLPYLHGTDLAALRDGPAAVRVTGEDPGGYVPLPGSWEDYRRSLKAEVRRKIDSRRRRLERGFGPVRLQVTTERAHLAERLYEFWRFRERAWQLRGRYDELAAPARGPKLSDFLHFLGRHADGPSVPAVATLTAGETVAAAAVLHVCGDRAWFYLCAHDLRLRALGPGITLLTECVRYAIEAGLTELELGRGDEPHKFTVGAQRRVRPNVRVDL
ncbi:MAG TPA: GNAT family N-acetyltransferase [Pseudonocardiaceae bacterium]|nr:GNAT family N-acetyltransferase [Pseudonocardiaceae bacterium]